MPLATEISAPFWEGLRARNLLIQQCNACIQWIFYPRRHDRRIHQGSLT